MAEKSLTATLSARDSIAETLDSIASSSLEAAEGMTLFGESSEDAGDEVEDAEDETEEFSDTLSSLIDNALSAAESLNITAEEAESVGDESAKSAGKVSSLVTSLKALDSIDDIDIDINQRLRGSDIGDGSRKRVIMGEGVDKVEVEDFLSEIGVENIPDEIDVEDPPDEIDVEDFPSHIDVDDVPRKIRVEDVDRGRPTGILQALGGIDPSARQADAEEIAEFTDQSDIHLDDFRSRFSFLEDIGTRDYSPADPESSILPEGRRSFGSRDIDLDIDWPSDGIEVDAGGDGSSLARMMGDGGGYSFGRLFSSLIPETDNLAGNLFDVDNAGDAAKETLSEIGDASVNLGPLNTSLKTTLTILPGVIAMLGSLAAVTGGFAIGGLGALGGLGAILGGGLWMAGQQRAQSMPMQEGEDGGFRQATAMEGLQSLLSDYGSQAKEALRPLQNQEFADLSLDFLEGGITLLGDFATSIRRLSPYLMAFADVLGQSFWQNEPAFIAEMEKLIVAMLPYVSDFITYFIREIPDALAFMRKEGVQLLPILGNFLTAFIDLLAPMTEIGTAIWSVLLPALTVLMDVFTGILSPIATFVVPVFETLGTVLNWISEEFGGVIQTIAQFLAIFLSISALPGIISTVITAISALSAAFSALSISFAMTPLGWIALAVAGIVTLLDHFDLLDDAIQGTIGFFDDLTSVIEDIAETVAIDVIAKIFPEVVNRNEEGGIAYDTVSQNIEEADESGKGFIGKTLAGFPSTLGFGLGKYFTGEEGQSPTSPDEGTSSVGDLATAESQTSGIGQSNVGSPQGYGQGGDTYVEVDARGSDEGAGRISRFVQQGVEEAKTDSRQRTSGGN